MSDYSYDPNEEALREAFDADPLAITTALVAAAVQQTAAQTAQAIGGENAAVFASQASIAAAHAAAELSQKYADWEQMAPYTKAVIDRTPSLIPNDDSMLDVPTLVNVMETAYRSGREDAAEAAADRRWQDIKNAGSTRLEF